MSVFPCPGVQVDVMTIPQSLDKIGDPWTRSATWPRRVQVAGFSGLLFTETGRTAYLNAAVASQAAPGLELSTGVAVAFPRSPFVTAAARELQEATGGKFRLVSDYNLLLVSRFGEVIHAGINTGIIRSMAGSGSVVTAAGLVFAFTMASFIVSDLLVLGQIGTTIALGLLFDTLIVRSFMTPSIAALLGRWFWWPVRVRQRPVPEVRRREHAAAVVVLVEMRAATPAG